MKKIFALFGAALVLASIGACGKPKADNAIETTNEITLPSIQASVDVDMQSSDWVNQAPQTEIQSEPATEPVSSTQARTEASTAPANPPETEASAPLTTQKELKKTGEMEFSDSKENKYIAAIVEKYGADPAVLAVIYTVPDNDGNLVFEFDGSLDSQGRVIRNEDTLIGIYSIDKELNSKRASKDSSLNEYSYGEMMVMFITTGKHILPEFKEELEYRK